MRTTTVLLVCCGIALGSASAAQAASPLLGQWSFDSSAPAGGGQDATPDTSGNGNSLKGPTGAIPIGTSGGKFAGYQGAGATQPLQVVSPVLAPQKLTLLMWIKQSGDPGRLRYLAGRGDDGPGTCLGSSFAMYTGYSGQPDGPGLYFYDRTGTTGASYITKPAPISQVFDGNWHLVAGTYDGTSLRLFVDGTQIGPAVPALPPTYSGAITGQSFYVGGYPQAGCGLSDFPGLIDEVRLYDRALSPTELGRLAAAPAGPTAPVLVPDQPVTPPLPATNIRPPVISDVFITKTLPRYLCDAGLWQNITSNFSYAWYRVDRPKLIFDPIVRFTKVSTAVTYDLPAADKGKEFYCEASASGADGKRVTVASPRRTLTGQKSAIKLVTTKTYGNVQVRGIDVFQTVQPDAQTQTFGWDRLTYGGLCGGGTPSVFTPGAANPTAACSSDPAQRSSNPQSVVYNGVKIDAQKDATAVVYVNTTDGPPADSNAKLLLRLRGFVHDKAVGDTITQTITGVRQRAAVYVTGSERGSSSSAYRVRIPWEWLHAAVGYQNRLELEASVSISVADTGFQECGQFSADCTKDNTFTLDFIPVYDDLPNLELRTVPLVGTKQKSTGVAGLAGPNSTLKVVTDIYPGGNRFRIEPFQAPIDITSADTLTINDTYCKAFKATNDLRGCKMAKVGALVATWLAADKANRTGYDALVGIHHYDAAGGDEPGWKPGGFELAQSDNVPRLFINDGSLSRPFTAAAHEFGHLLGAPHADQAAPDPISGLPCGGNSNGQVGEAWPPDNFGLLQSYAFDTYDGLPGSTRKTDIEYDRPSTNNKNFVRWDLMSYCAPENRAWVSAKNWNRYFGTLQFANKRGRPTFYKRRATATAAGQAFAVGSVGHGGVTIDRVVPASPDNGVPKSVAGSSLTITALGSNGQALGTAGADVHFDQDGPAGVGTFTAPLPAGATAVVAQAGGKTLARVQRTTPPKVTVTAPKRGTHVKGGKRSKLVVKWKTIDPDSSDRLARLEYAADGRSFRTVWQGKDTGRASLAGRSLAAGTKARVRVVVNDGFSDGKDESSRFRADGAPPVVTITSPGPGETLSTGAHALLKGYATDDRGKALGRSKLTWFAGRRRLGRGGDLDARLPTGKVKLRLVARDRLGRTASASRSVRVAKPPLYVTRLSSPARVTLHAKTVSIRIAASARSTLKVGKRSYSVTTKSRKLKLTLPRSPKTGSLAVRFTLRKKGARTVKGVVRVVRI